MRPAYAWAYGYRTTANNAFDVHCRLWSVPHYPSSDVKHLSIPFSAFICLSISLLIFFIYASFAANDVVDFTDGFFPVVYALRVAGVSG